MEVKEIKVLARASYSYNVGEVEMTVSDATEEELKSVEKKCILEASKIAKSLATINEKEAPKKEPVITTTVQTQRPSMPQKHYNPQNITSAPSYVKSNQQFQQRPMQQGYQPKMVSQAQINFLKGLGYNGTFEGMTSKQAINIIQTLKNQQQMSAPQEPIDYSDFEQQGY